MKISNIIWTLISTFCAIGFLLLYWSGMVSPTTNDNWQGVVGEIFLSLGIGLFISMLILRLLKQ